MLPWLCVWGALAVAASAAPALAPGWIPCLSTRQGYGLCEESLFAGRQSHQQQNINWPSYLPQQTNQPSYLPQQTNQPSYLPKQTNQPSYPPLHIYEIYGPPEEQVPTTESSIGGIKNHLILFLPSHESSAQAPPEQTASNSTEINELFDRLFKILDDVRKSNREEEERRAKEPTLDFKQIREALQKVNEASQKVTKLVFGSAYLHQKLDGKADKDVPDFDQLDKIFGNIEGAAKNISDLIATVKQNKEETKDGKKDEKCSAESKDCKTDEKEAVKDSSEVTEEKGSQAELPKKDVKNATESVSKDIDKLSGTIDDEDAKVEDAIKNLNENEAKKGTGSKPNDDSKVKPEEETKSEPKDDSKVDPKEETKSEPQDDSKVDPKEETETEPKDASELKPEEDTKSEPQDDSKVDPKEENETEPKDDSELKPEEDTKSEPEDKSAIDPEKDIKAYIESVTEKLDGLEPPKEPTPSEMDSNHEKKNISELDNKALIDRLIEDVHDIAKRGVENLETVTPTDLSEADREKAFDALLKDKYSNDETKSLEVIMLHEQLDSFGRKAKELIEKGVELEDLSKTIDALGEEKSPETDLTEKFESVTKEDVDTLKETVTNLLASGVPLEKIDALVAKLDDFDKEKNSTILEAKAIDDSTLDNIIGEKQLREELSDFGKIVSRLYEKGITQELIDNLDKKVSGLKDHSMVDILNTLESKKKEKREVHDEAKLYEELYDIIAEIVYSNFTDASIDAYVRKIDDLTASGVRIETSFEATVQIVTDIVDIHERPKRKVKDDVIQVRKNELFDVIKDVLYDDSNNTVEAYFKKVDDMIRRGVEPVHILGFTLSDLFLLLLVESQMTPSVEVVQKVDNSELYDLIETAVKSNVSDTSMAAFNKKVDELVSNGVNPIQLAFDVVGDLFILLSRERPKREVDPFVPVLDQPVQTYKEFILSKLVYLKSQIGEIKPFVTLQTGEHWEQFSSFISKLDSILDKMLQYTTDQVEAMSPLSVRI